VTILNTSSLIWLMIGFILFFLEYLLSGRIILFFGAGALVVSVLGGIFAINVDTQIFIFIVSSLVLMSSLKDWVKKIIPARKNMLSRSKPEINNSMIGKEAIAMEDFKDGEGKIKFQGENWEARSQQNTEDIEKGNLVKIVDKSGKILVVRRLHHQEV